MNAGSDSPSISEPLRAQAVEWHVRLASEAADNADWLAFEAWLAQSPEHLRAYEAVEALWSELDALAAEPAATGNVTPFRPRPARRPPTWAPAAIAASLVAFVAVGVGWWQAPPRPESYQTAAGERRVVTLADGTHITLNGGSRLTATLGRHERRVVMADAEAVFDVAKDPSRPFFIDAGQREIRVVGTEFNVLNTAGEVRVTVRRGIVEVRPADQPTGPALARLVKGQALEHRDGQPQDVVAAADPDAALAWTEGRLVFQGERLEDVAATLNRYVRTPIEVAPDVRDTPVRATLVIGPEDDMLASLAAFLPVQSERRGDRVWLSLRRQTR